MQTALKRHSKYLKFCLFIIGISILIGIFYYQIQSNDIKNNIINTLNNSNNFRYNAIFKDLIIMSLLLVASFFIIGMPLSIFYLFYESMGIGFLLSIFFATFKIKGLLYIIIYIFFYKTIPLILIIFFIKKIINISRYIIGLIIYKNDNNVKNKLFLNFKKSLYIIVFVLIINIILYNISPYFNEVLANLLK